MKKIIGIVFISLMFCNIGFSEITFIEEKKIKEPMLDPIFISVCIDGYKFVVVNTAGSSEPSIVQAFEERDEKSLPAKC